jgi:DNA-binding CsgD family transcriptional regulator
MIQVEEKRIKKMLEGIMQVAKGNYHVELEVSAKQDKIDALAIGINMMIDDIRLQQEEKIAEQKRLFKMALDKIYEGVGLISKNFSTYGDTEITSRIGYLMQKKDKTGHSELMSSFINVLTKREMEVLKYIVEGYTSKQIAEKLSISVRTSTTHRSNLMSKLKVKNKSQLLNVAAGNTLSENRNAERPL